MRDNSSTSGDWTVSMPSYAAMTFLVADNSSVATVSPPGVHLRFVSTLSTTEDIVVGSYLIVVECMAILLNGSILGLSAWKRRTLKVSDWYVVWLAMSDLGHPVVGYPMTISSSFKHAWVYGDIGCQWNAFTGFFFGVNSMITLAAMSLSRLFIITQPDFARQHSNKMAVCLIGFTLLYALFWAACPFLGWGQYGPEPYKTSCTLVWDQPDQTFVTAAFIGCLAIPAATMCYSYYRILHLAIRTRHERLKWSSRSCETRVWEKKEMRLLKITIIMCASFMVCWTPYSVVAMLKAYSSNIHLSPSLSVLPALAAKTSHIIDPVIYCGMNRNFNRIIPELCRRGQEVIIKDHSLSVPLKGVGKYSAENKD
nr:opsin-5B [Ambigolimax valentianus]